MRGTRYYFAGVNTRPLIAATSGQDVLVSYAQVKDSPALWAELRERILAGHFRSVILDSGAFTELSARKRGKVFKVGLVEYADFALENAECFDWIANLDDIEGDVKRSNGNFAYLRARGLDPVPVYHEGEGIGQLLVCIAMARESKHQTLAIGCQRPKGKLVPTKAVAFLDWIFPILARRARGLKIHGFGLTRYASPECPGRSAGFPFDSVDSTTWIAEACKVFNAGATSHRHEAFKAAVDSYQAVCWAGGTYWPTAFHGVEFDRAKAIEAGGQAKTVAIRGDWLREALRRALDRR